MIPRGEMIEMIIEGALATVPSKLHPSDTFCKRGRDYLDISIGKTLFYRNHEYLTPGDGNKKNKTEKIYCRTTVPSAF
jgi:hypothetical protein